MFQYSLSKVQTSTVHLTTLVVSFNVVQKNLGTYACKGIDKGDNGAAKEAKVRVRLNESSTTLILIFINF